MAMECDRMAGREASTESRSRLVASVLGVAVLTFLVLVAGCEVCRKASRGVISAAQSGDLSRLQFVLRWCPWLADAKDRYGNTPLHYAALNGQRDVAHFLIGKGASIDIFIASGLGMSDVIAEMLAGDPGRATRTGDMSRTPLHWAALWGNVQTADMLLEHGADLEAEAAGGLTPSSDE